jgi:sugar phosphate isomerase/epimerase
VKIALSQISTPAASFGEDVAAYAAAGFDGLGIWEFKLPAGDDAANARLLRQSGLGTAYCVPEIPSVLQLALPGMEGPAEPAERIEALCASMHRLARFEPACVLCLTGPRGDRSEDDARVLVSEGLREIAAAARAAGVRLGLEPTHLSESGVTSFLSTIGETIALLDAAGLDDVGVMVDTVHVWDTKELEAEVTRHASRATGLHAADKLAAGDPGRVLPGEGITHPEHLVGLMRSAGFDGYVDIEIFSTPDAFWGLPVEEAARRAAAAARSLIAQS